MPMQLILAVILGIGVLLFLILRLKIQAFLALLITCVFVGLVAGMSSMVLIDSIKNGMGGTLGFVATVVGLGALFGAILEYSGGAAQLAVSMLQIFGTKNAPWAIMITGFLVAIPVFFDVAFIILVPMLYALQKKSGKSLLLYAIPLLAGLAITHAFIPPTPGPIAVAEIIGANLGWVILFGGITAIPTAIIAGPLFGKWIAKRIHLDIPSDIPQFNPSEPLAPPTAATILAIIGIPIVLIVLETLVASPLMAEYRPPQLLVKTLAVIGHPFVALIIANLIAWYVLGIRRGVEKEVLLNISTKALLPAGVIILLTGAGGAFKQVLIDTGIGELIASYVSASELPILLFGFVIAAIVRVLQGSATVAMITAAGLVAPLVMGSNESDIQLALLVIAIASGASIFSHVNDSGFWLVKQYLGMTENETFRSWTLLTTLIAVVGLTVSMLLWYIV